MLDSSLRRIRTAIWDIGESTLDVGETTGYLQRLEYRRERFNFDVEVPTCICTDSTVNDTVINVNTCKDKSSAD